MILLLIVRAERGRGEAVLPARGQMDTLPDKNKEKKTEQGRKGRKM